MLREKQAEMCGGKGSLLEVAPGVWTQSAENLSTSMPSVKGEHTICFDWHPEYKSMAGPRL